MFRFRESPPEPAEELPAITVTPERRERKKQVECRILHPDRSMYLLHVQPDCKGQDCLDQMCDILGIVEKDYFGMQYVDKQSGCNIWINNRLQVRNQVKTQPPFLLIFSIKYYTDPDLILQHSTMEAFCKALKYQIKKGDIHIPDTRKSIIGAKLAQVELGDHKEDANGMCKISYPAYFPHWNSGIAHLIAKEHAKLKGCTQREAMMMFLIEVYMHLQDSRGLHYVPAVMNGEGVTVWIGGPWHFIQIFDTQKQSLHKIPYYSLTQVAFGSNFFGFNYQSRGEDQSLSEKKIRVYLRNHTVSRNIFRMVTEEQVFFYQTIVQSQVLEHAEGRHHQLKKLCKKVLGMKFETKYYYDIVRTKHEAYRHAWQQVHQLSQYQMDDTAIRSTTQATMELEDDESASGMLRQQSAVYWGLSTSSCNIAKQLLPESQLRPTESEENFLLMCGEPKMEGGHVGSTSTEPLTHAQGKKLRQLLLKIQDERLCHVCMNELISSVFCPCGHYVACYSCSKRVEKCPICRQQVGYVQYVYNGTA